jgi:hypothetical protein
MSARDNGGLYHYYACTGRQKYGPKACSNQRLPREKLECAVISQLTRLYRDGDLIEAHSRTARQEAEQRQPEIEQLEKLLTTGEPQKAKALIRELVAELKVNGKNEILPSYYLNAAPVCATSEKVERIGIEPMTSALQRRRSPS